MLQIIFSFALAGVAHAHDVLATPAAICARVLTVDGFKADARQTPRYNRDAVFTLGDDQAIVRVSSVGVDVLTIVDNRAAGLDLTVRAEPLVRLLPDHEIMGSRINARRDEMHLHVSHRVSFPWPRTSNYVVPIDTRPGRIFAKTPQPGRFGDLPTRAVLPELGGSVLYPLRTEFQKMITDTLDRDANLYRLGSLTVGSQSRLLGQLSTIDAWYGLYAREAGLEDEDPADDLADLETILANQRVRLSLVRLGDRTEVAHFEMRGHITRDFASFDGPSAVYLLAKLPALNSNTREPRDASPDAHLIRVELPNPRWEAFEFGPFKSSRRAGAAK